METFMTKKCVLTLMVITACSPLWAQQPGEVPSNSVIACDSTEYMGHCETFALQSGRRHLLVPNPAGLQAKISSIAVGDQVEVWAFSGPWFTGPSVVIDRNLGSFEAPPLTSWAKGQNRFYSVPWSIKLKPAPSGATGGITVGGGQPQGPAIYTWNDRIGSFIVYPRGSEPPGVHVLGKSIGSIGSPGAFAPPVSRFFPMPENQSQLRQHYGHLSDFDDQALFVRVPKGVEVELFDQPSEQGNRLTIPGAVDAKTPASAFTTAGWMGEIDPNTGAYSFDHWYALNRYQFSGTTSSLIVRVRGWTMAMEAPERGGEGDPHRHRAPPASTEMKQVGKVLPVEGSTPGLVEAQPLATDTDLGALTLEPNTDRPGHNYKDFELAEPRADTCRAACAADPKCMAYTYVNPGIQGSSAHCWLKHTAAPAKSASCCVSGARKTVD
jgi:hypothetical protein